MRHIYLAIFAILFVFNMKAQSVASFEDLTLAPESYWNGSDQSGSFKSGEKGGEITLINSYNPDWQSWSGFAYSNMTDVTTAGYTNQYSAITGKGFEGSANYAVCYPSPSAELGFTLPGKIMGFYITNSTYAYLSMKNGDAFAKKFGGETGNDPDYFKLMIETLDGIGQPVDTLDFYLADFRFADNSKDYILSNWTWIDLSNLKVANKLRFSLSSSDNAVWGINTPGYFCMDNIKYEIMVSAPKVKQIQASVFPNPFTDHISISGINDKAEVTISNLLGRIVKEYNNISNNEPVSELQNLNSGVYFVKITEGKNQFTTKLIKK
jgi:hypothetical protein